jgi:hypothetical protein
VRWTITHDSLDDGSNVFGEPSHRVGAFRAVALSGPTQIDGEARVSVLEVRGLSLCPHCPTDAGPRNPHQRWTLANGLVSDLHAVAFNKRHDKILG